MNTALLLTLVITNAALAILAATILKDKRQTRIKDGNNQEKITHQSQSQKLECPAPKNYCTENLMDFLSRYINSVEFAVSVFNSEGKRIFTNQKLINLFGITDENYIKDDSHLLWNSPANSTSLINKIRESDSGSVNLKIDFKNEDVRQWYQSINSDTKYFNVFFSKQKISPDTEPYIFITVIDMTPQEHLLQYQKNTQELFCKINALDLLKIWRYHIENSCMEYLNEAGLSAYSSLEDFYSFFVPQDIVMLKDAIQKHMEGKTENTIFVLRAVDENVEGGYSYWNTEVRSVFENGKVVSVEGLCNKITYRTILNNIKSQKTESNPDKSFITSFIYDVKKDELIISGRKEKIPFEEYLKKIKPEDLDVNKEIISSIKNGAIITTSESYNLCVNGEWTDRQFFITPKEISGGKVLVYKGVVSSNPKWDKLINSAQDTDRFLKTIMNSVPCMLTVKDPEDDFRYIMASNNFCEITEMNQNTLKRHNDFEIFGHNKISEECYIMDNKVLKDGESVSFDTEFSLNDVKYSLHITKTLFTDMQGRKYIISSAINDSELRSTIEQLKEAKNNAERSDKLKSAFLNNINHEIRTPLNAICGFSELMAKENKSEKMKSYYDIIRQNNNMLLELLDNILDTSKMAAGYVDLTYSSFDFAKLFRHIYETYQDRKNPNTEFLCSNPYPHCIINGDIDRLKQVMGNYVSNALKNTENGYVKMDYKYQEDGIYFSVEDTGSGISVEHRDKVFCRFEKIDPHIQGSGLGLAISKSIIESAGGYVGFKSEEGHGSKFWAWFPCEVKIFEKAPTDYESPQGEDVITTPINKKVLIAEDEDGNFSLLKTYLKDNYIIDRAYNGKEAVDKALTQDYAIILMDITMPEYDGLWATKMLREKGITIPIIAVTANAYQSDRENALKAGCTNFIAKPINIMKFKLIMGKYGFFV